jgi:peptidoglycan/LPS O-acetylase OafA/YrhL
MKDRNQSLDVLRGVAILLVLGRHFPYYNLWTRAGWIGVDLFFVLSGFLISGLLFREYRETRAISLKRFFIRRGFKIYPPYYAFLLLTMPLTIGRLTWADLTFMQSYFTGFWGHGWSLSVEEHFYIILPLALMLSLALFPRSDFRWIPYALPVVMAVCLAMRAAVGPHATNRQVIDPTHLRIDALFAGVTLGWLYHFKMATFLSAARKIYLLPVGLFLSSSAFFVDQSSYWIYTFGLTANFVGFAAIVMWAIENPGLGRLKPLATIGSFSYSIYLWHWPLWQVVERVFGLNLIGFWTYVLASFGVGIAMAKAIEVPSLRFRDRIFSSSEQPYFSLSGTTLSSSTTKGGPAAYVVSQIVSDSR